ncbi:hypothetical protein H6P81_012227 [Aristolochia fimbriata]|uniref:Uncharacterized protein n=1 Tax=Aristolochia fimbriata TaxID=158543 RepID=A0AAV7EBS0_ARIFI|nr:hypothetical protein H6P81_012227 [Aristolochia fimbriata]
MKNTIRCCISCILPCGALDVIRVVHSDGRVEEFTKSISAGEVMKAHPKHVLRKSSLSSSDHQEAAGAVPRIMILPPDAELQRGKIYFLVPVSSPPQKPRRGGSSSGRRKKKLAAREVEPNSVMTKLLISDHYLSEILSEKVSSQRDRRRGRVGVWRPHLESISEAPIC